MTTVADVSIERLLERAVAQARIDSPRAVALLQALAGRRLCVQILGTPMTLRVESTGQSLRLATGDTVDATVAGAPLSLLMLAGNDPRALTVRGDVRIDGDAQIAEQFRELGMLLRPDLEAGLSRLVGRSAAHVAMLGLHAARDWTRTTARTATQNVAEYLAHERGDLVSRAEAEHFLRGVEQVREHLDRLEARLQQLEHRSPEP